MIRGFFLPHQLRWKGKGIMECTCPCLWKKLCTLLSSKIQLNPTDEAILEALTSSDRPWDDLHHRSYLLSDLGRIEVGEFVLTMTRDRSCPINPLNTHIVYTEGNMETIAKTIPIDISRTPGVVDNVFIRVDCSLEEIQIYTDLFK
jgi:hypothetical protein